MFQKNKRDRKRYQIARNELRKRTRNEYWIKIRQTINSRSAPVSPTIFIHKSPPPASEETLFFSLSRGISRGKGRVESDSRKRNSLYESSARVHTILFSLFTPPFFLFDRSIIRRIVSMDRRSPEILLDPFPIVSRSRLLFLFFVSREGEGGEEIEEEKQWWATCKLIPCVRT